VQLNINTPFLVAHYFKMLILFNTPSIHQVYPNHSEIFSRFRNQDCKERLEILWNTQTFGYFQGLYYCIRFSNIFLTTIYKTPKIIPEQYFHLFKIIFYLDLDYLKVLGLF
jgi:hypothetical protein